MPHPSVTSLNLTMEPCCNAINSALKNAMQEGSGDNKEIHHNKPNDRDHETKLRDAPAIISMLIDQSKEDARMQ